MRICTQILLSISICVSLVAVCVVRSFAEGEQEMIVEKYFAALQHGDTVAIEEMLTGKMLSNNRVLLKKNKAYSKLLIHRYARALLKIKNSTIIGCASEVKADIFFSNSEVQSITLILIKNGEGVWKIEDEI